MIKFLLYFTSTLISKSFSDFFGHWFLRTRRNRSIHYVKLILVQRCNIMLSNKLIRKLLVNLGCLHDGLDNWKNRDATKTKTKQNNKAAFPIKALSLRGWTSNLTFVSNTKTHKNTQRWRQHHSFDWFSWAQVELEKLHLWSASCMTPFHGCTVQQLKTSTDILYNYQVSSFNLSSHRVTFCCNFDRSLADPRGVPGTCPPHVQILSFSCSFRQKIWKIIG